ncbi:glycosyltransferase [Clostridium taeniosporum]|uniref:glycosyltransferase n=1 Tax=Clostridium taeniosporum TaxID=394958 RepID=UPI003B82D8B2
MEAFKIIQDKISNWNVELVGNIDPNFSNYLNKYFKENPNLVDRIILSGRLDKRLLKKSYEDAKIFCLTSQCEACANVFAESLSNGCYLISSDVDGVLDITDFGHYGKILPTNNAYVLAQILLETCNNDNLLKTNCKNSQIYAKSNLKWIDICHRLDNLIKYV